MKKQGILIILISLLNLNFQVKEELSEEAIYSRILTEYLSEIIEEKNVKVLIKKELERKSLEEELTFEDLGYLHSISKNLVIIEDGIGRPDSIMVNMVNKFEKDESQHEIDFGKIELKHEVEYISKRKFLRKSKSKKEWRRISKKNPTSLILLEFSNLVFSEDNRFCALYIGFVERGVFGGGSILVVDLEGDNLIKCEIPLWVSCYFGN